MFTNKLTAEQRIERSHVALMGHPSTLAFGGVLMVGNVTVDESCPTAKTNGRDVVYGREFVESLSESELNGLILHENLHKTYQHLWLWKDLYKQNAQVANLACDAVINLEIQDMAPGGIVTLPRGGFLQERFRMMDAKQVFDILMDETGGDASGSGHGFDEHDWGGAEELTTEELEAVKKEIDSAVRQGALAASKLKGTVPRGMLEIMDPVVDWREQLREFATVTCQGRGDSTWRKPNRRWMHQGIYMPSSISETVGQLVIGVDTSGSIGGEELNKFMSEVVGLCEMVQPELVHLLYWDSEVAGHEVYGGDGFSGMATSTKPVGGGGTDPSCVPTYMREKNITPQAVIMLTDGYIFDSWGDWICPVLWCVVGSCPEVPPVGSLVRVK